MSLNNHNSYTQVSRMAWAKLVNYIVSRHNASILTNKTLKNSKKINVIVFKSCTRIIFLGRCIGRGRRAIFRCKTWYRPRSFDRWARPWPWSWSLSRWRRKRDWTQPWPRSCFLRRWCRIRGWTRPWPWSQSWSRWSSFWTHDMQWRRRIWFLFNELPMHFACWITWCIAWFSLHGGVFICYQFMGMSGWWFTMMIS